MISATKNTSILMITVLIFSWCVSVQAQEKKILERKALAFIVGTHASSNVIDVYFEFLKIAYDEIGYDITLRKVPIKRAYNNVNEGFSDGMVMIPKQVLETYKDIVIVPEPLTTIDIVAITTGRHFKIDGPESIKPYKLGILRGYALTKKLTQGMQRQIVNNHKSLLSILKANRVDLALAMKRETIRFLNKNPQYENITILDPPVFSLSLHNCLNKKHEALVERIDPVIKRLIHEGVLKELYKPFVIQ